MAVAGSYELKQLTLGIYEPGDSRCKGCGPTRVGWGASGVIGVDLVGSLNDERGGSVIHLLGTAIRRTGRRDISPALVLSLAD